MGAFCFEKLPDSRLCSCCIGVYLLTAKSVLERKEPTMTNAIATEIRDRAEFMAIDELGNLWIGGDGLKNADNRADVDRLLELGAITYGGPGYYHVNKGYENLFNRL